MAPGNPRKTIGCDTNRTAVSTGAEGTGLSLEGMKFLEIHSTVQKGDGGPASHSAFGAVTEINPFNWVLKIPSESLIIRGRRGLEVDGYCWSSSLPREQRRIYFLPSSLTAGQTFKCIEPMLAVW